MIPPIIHYCWFGRGELPPLARRCMDSWRKYLPDYEFRLWNEDNFDVNALAYTRDAYAAGKYAFVSDYARFLVLYREGGVYFDTDVEVIAKMDDVIERGPFMGWETPSAVAPGLGMAAEPHMPVYEEILERFARMDFYDPQGGVNPYTMIPMVTDVLCAHGLLKDGTRQAVAGVEIYPSEWFNPFEDATGRLHTTANTRTIHWYAKSWMPPQKPWWVAMKRMVHRLTGL